MDRCSPLKLGYTGPCQTGCAHDGSREHASAHERRRRTSHILVGIHRLIIARARILEPRRHHLRSIDVTFSDGNYLLSALATNIAVATFPSRKEYMVSLSSSRFETDAFNSTLNVIHRFPDQRSLGLQTRINGVGNDALWPTSVSIKITVLVDRPLQ